MTLLITVFAAIISTIVWYIKEQECNLKLGTLCVLYWGASIMWFVDAIFEYAELKADYFSPAVQDMLNDTYLGLSVVALGMIVWLVRMLIADPRGVIKKMLFN